MIIERQEWVEELEKMVKPNTSKYDVVVPVSGGKDGMFTLWYLSKYSNLRLLAFHIDNWYVSETAQANIKNICKKLGCDVEIVRPDWDSLQKIYKELLLKNGEVCIACEMMISLYPIEAAVKNKIPYIVWGLTPNQIREKKINSGFSTINYSYYENIVKYYDMLINVAMEDKESAQRIKNRILINNAIKESDAFPTFVLPFFWTGYDAYLIEKTVKEEIGWERSKDVGGTSSNCIINQLHIYLKQQIKGKEFYENMMNKKYENNEVTKEIKEYALSNRVDEKVNHEILDELDVKMSMEEVIQSIKSTKKDLLLKMESNISQ